MATTADTLAQSADAAFTKAQTLADNSLTRSDTALAEARTAVTGLQSAGYVWPGLIADIKTVPIIKPILPTHDFSTDVSTAFDYAFGSFNSVIQPQIVNYLTAFFPDIAATLKSGSDQWLIDTIVNGRFVPVSIETALWNRAKDRETQESVRAEQEVIDATASRGFSAPTGVLNYAVAVNQQELAKKLTGINREIAIKAFDTANENTKFAIQQAVALRTAFVAALGDFIKTAMAQPNNAVDYAKTILAAKTGLYDSAIRLYSAQIDEEKLRTGILLENQTIELRGSELNASNLYKMFETNVNKARIQSDVAMSAADQLAKVAAAAMATRNSVVSVSAGV